ncbi:hypothetical protein Nepgr_010254 [Nepenthes gracilis]|uniref:Uncharacterized protein n=1 Tax=Nepenthes gracilis TaxID=150966 RepID=A0AAD3XL51_NEPGR|nr:hypothetical protein Nepgr_010254 [Nepenthes gracilis]
MRSGNCTSAKRHFGRLHYGKFHTAYFTPARLHFGFNTPKKRTHHRDCAHKEIALKFSANKDNVLRLNALRIQNWDAKLHSGIRAITHSGNQERNSAPGF